jgi:hypothetical protein
MDLDQLEQMITEDEVWGVIKTLPSNKAPGLDGYSVWFYKLSWQIIKVNFMAAVGKVMQGDVNRLYLLNLAYITLIPKMVEVLEVKDYHPISLIHSLAKIITKILASRLAEKLPSLVS